ncbi:MAG: FAD binding domain-containing protein [Linnemannia elongata]|nr:MAG: FAD binding domain-containing protein [Linnemannia elongata]
MALESSSSSSGSPASPASSASSSIQPSPPQSPSLNATNSSNIDIPVLISGAGPTGLMAGLLLAKMGIPSRIIEREMTPNPDSRAVGTHARSIEIFKLTDKAFYEEVGSQSWRSESMRFYFGNNLVADLKTKRSKDSEFHVPWMLAQTQTVKLLTEAYEKTGMGKIERGWELLDTKVVEQEQEQVEHQQAEDGTTQDVKTSNTMTSWVETTIRRAIEGTNKRKGEPVALGTVEMVGEDEDKDYEVKVVRSEYLIASDGGRSTVRHRLNIPFPGRTRDYNLILFDGQVETDLSTTNITSIKGDNNHSIGMFPIRGNRVRMMLDDGMLTQEQFNAREPKTPNKEHFEKLLQETLGTLKLKVLSYNWLSYYRVNERRATEFSHKRRIFLAGDAAHCHSPAGGQGMNTGLQDSYNLAWKIALVLNGTAPQSLLDSYSEERIPIADEVIKLSAKTLDNGIYQGWLSSNMKRIMLSIVPFFNRYLPKGNSRPTFSMLGLRYYENSVNKAHKSQNYLATEPASIGQRAPDDILVPFTAPANSSVPRSESLAELEDDSADQPTTTRLYELLAFPGVFHIVVFAANRLAKEKDFESGLFKDVDHYQRVWSSRWPGLRGVLELNASSEAMTSKKMRSTPQFMVHVISSAIPTSFESDRDETTTASMADRAVGFGKIYVDCEGGRLHERYGFAGVSTKESGGGIVVLRPDTHIAFRVSNVDSTAWVDVDEYFGSILVN